MNNVLEAHRNEKILTLSIPIEGMKTDEIEELLAFIKAEIITRKSKMTAEEAFELGEEIKASWWRENGERIKKMIDEYESESSR